MTDTPGAAPQDPAPITPLTSRFPTRIHRLTVPVGGLDRGVGGPTRPIDLLAPVDPDALLDDPVVEQRYKADNYLPYWPIIWPSGLMLAARILTETTTPPLPPQPTENDESKNKNQIS
jgi:hypothetical protein